MIGRVVEYMEGAVRATRMSVDGWGREKDHDCCCPKLGGPTHLSSPVLRIELRLSGELLKSGHAKASFTILAHARLVIANKNCLS